MLNWGLIRSNKNIACHIWQCQSIKKRISYGHTANQDLSNSDNKIKTGLAGVQVNIKKQKLKEKIGTSSLQRHAKLLQNMNEPMQKMDYLENHTMKTYIFWPKNYDMEVTGIGLIRSGLNSWHWFCLKPLCFLYKQQIQNFNSYYILQLYE
jgi:hypothetical protein